MALAVGRDLGEGRIVLRLLVRETGVNAMLSEEMGLPVDSRPPPRIAVTAFGWDNLATTRTAVVARAVERGTIHTVVIGDHAGHGAPATDAACQDGEGLERYIVPHEGDPDNRYTTSAWTRSMPRCPGRCRRRPVRTSTR